MQNARNYFISLLTLVLFSLGFSANSYAASKSKDKWLFVLSAQQAKLEISSKDSKKDKLIISDAKPVILSFTDRPSRKSRLVSTQDFLSSWSTIFTKNKTPNAGFAFSKASNSITADPIMLSLEKPINSKSKKQWTWSVELNKNTRKYLLENQENNITYSDVYLFIDDVGITDSITQTNVKVLGEAPVFSVG